MLSDLRLGGEVLHPQLPCRCDLDFTIARSDYLKPDQHFPATEHKYISRFLNTASLTCAWHNVYLSLIHI